MGTREAGKALLRAAEAAATPDPRAARRAGERVRAAGETGKTVKREAGRFGKAMWEPMARASGMLWLELTGVFFALFALTAAIEVYRHWGDFRAVGAARQHVWFAAGMGGLFGWFAVSSFARARRRGRRR